MFDLEQAIIEWRQQMVNGGVTSSEVLDELESHLRDDVDQLLDSSLSAEEAFNEATGRIGQADALTSEFAKFSKPKKTQKQRTLAFAGAGENYETLAMNTPQLNMTIERPWMTYLKAAAWLLPSLSLWMLSTVFLFPKLKQIWMEASFDEPFPRAGMFVSDFFARHGIVIFVAVILGLGLLEWRSGLWKRYRRACLSFATFALNSAVLFLIWLMLVTALVAAPALLQLGKKSPPPAASAEK